MEPDVPREQYLALQSSIPQMTIWDLSPGLALVSISGPKRLNCFPSGTWSRLVTEMSQEPFNRARNSPPRARQRPLAALQGPASSPNLGLRDADWAQELRGRKSRWQPQSCGQRFESGSGEDAWRHAVLCGHAGPRTQRHSSHPVFQSNVDCLVRQNVIPRCGCLSHPCSGS